MVTRTAPRVALSPAEAANALGLSRETVYHAMRTGRLASVSFGTRRLIPMTAIDDLLSKASSEPWGKPDRRRP